MSSPDQLDQVVRLTSAREWLALLSLVLLVVCAFVWGFEGRLPTRTEAGGVILSVQPGDASELEAAVFVPALKAQELKPGMDVEITLSFLRAGEFGFLRGKVRAVAEYPSTDAALMATLQYSPVAQAVAAQRPVNEVRVQLIRERGTPSGYQWSTKKGAPVKIAPATPCLARIIVRQDPPVTLVIPTIKNRIEAF